MKRRLSVAICATMIAFVVSSHHSAHAQIQMPRSVQANGGQRAVNDTFAVAGTAGQVVVGTATNTTHQIQVGFWLQDVQKPVAVETPPGNLPREFRLDQNYPNPFWSGATSRALSGGNPGTTIRFALPHAEEVTLKILDLSGREVATLVNEKKPAGEYSVSFDGRRLASGIYFYQLRAGGFVQQRKLALVK